MRTLVSVLAVLPLAAGCMAPASAQHPAPSPAVAHPAPPPAVAGHFERVRARFSGQRARETVAFVEQRWRLPGNTGFDESIDRVAGELKAAGFVEESTAKPGDRLTYRVERHPMAAPAWDPVDASLTIVGQDSALLRWTTNRNMLAVNSYATPAGGVTAAVVSVGAGQPEDWAGKDVAGKIVYGDAPMARLFTEAVTKRGALGVLAYSLPDYTQPERYPTSIQFGRIPLDTASRSWGIFLSFGAREQLRRALAAGPVTVRVTTDARLFPSEERTVVADVRGATQADERFVFSAHVQEPGANDNASGVGAQMEMARVLATLVRDGAYSPERTITFLWGNEIVGTRRYLESDPARTRGVRWGMSLDMVGEDTERTGGTFLIEKMPDPSAVWTRGDERHSEWGGKPLAVEDIRPHYFNDLVLARALDQSAATGWVVRTNPFEGGSDHTPFLNAGKPGLLLWHFTDVFYHTDNDRLDKVSAATMTNVGTTALVTAMTLATADGATARQLVDELERAALARLATETALSRAALQGGATAAEERRILETWADYYVRSLATMQEIEVGGASAATQRHIEGAQQRVAAAGRQAVEAIGG
jgi:hypothetical protein